MPSKTKTTSSGPNPPSKRLFRSSNDRLLAGVCGGIASYFNIDPSIVRLVFIAVGVFGGGGVLAYLLLWIVLPSESQKGQNSNVIHENVKEIKTAARNFGQNFQKSDFHSSPNIGGLILLAIGILFLLRNTGLLPFWEIGQLWPLILIAIGIAMISRRHE